MSSHKRHPRRRADSSSTAEPDCPAPNAERPAEKDPDAGIRRGKLRIRESVETILGALQRQAEEGSCAHAKFLFEFAGIEFGAEKSGAEDSLSAILLQRLEEMQNRWREQQGESQQPEVKAVWRATACKVE